MSYHYMKNGGSVLHEHPQSYVLVALARFEKVMDTIRPGISHVLCYIDYLLYRLQTSDSNFQLQNMDLSSSSSSLTMLVWTCQLEFQHLKLHETNILTESSEFCHYLHDGSV